MNSQLGGLTMQEITGAYTSICQVTVKGNAFILYRINGTYQCIDVESIEIHGREHAPLIVNMWHDNNKYGFYSSGQWSSGWNDAEFTYVEPSDYLNSTLFYRVTLSGGDAVRFAADSYQPFSVRIHVSVGSNSTEFMRVLGSVLFEFENVTSIYREFTADARGEYSFSFYVGYRIDDDFLVDFRIGRVDDSK
ncbi:MAG: hypothetical protein NTY03_03020 [Candidatus Bathyarchaeota archaeon]|nr:hypothetical protein [Candidatus Bathyarchaeota archaeon]